MIIYITGIDGSGKTTIAEKLKNSIFKDKYVISIWARYKPKIVKLLLAPFKRNYVSDTSKYYIMNNEQFSQWLVFKKKIAKHTIISKILYLIQSVDYYLQLIQYRKAFSDNKDKIVIIDRLYLDFIIDQSINYGDISRNIFTKIFMNKMKSFDFIFYIDVDEEIAFKRKDDIPSIVYFQGKKKYYEQYISQLKNAYTISNNGDISEAMKEIQQLLNNK